MPAHLITWYVALAAEAVLMVRLGLRCAWLPCFLAYLCIDLPRWCLLAIADAFGTPKDYAQIWSWSEPVSVALLVLCVWEAIGRRGGWVGVAVPTLLSGCAAAVLGHPIGVRMVVAGLCAVLLTVAVSVRWNVHSCILGLFCAVDFIAHAAVVMGSPNPRVAQFCIYGQALCILLWLRYPARPPLAQLIRDRL